MNNNDKKKHLVAFKRSVGLNIWKAIDQSGLSRDFVAEKMGVTLRTVNYWQSGQKTPSIDNFYLLCRLLDVSLESLLG